MTAEASVGHWPVDLATYHTDRECISHSGLELFRYSIPLYHARYITGTESFPAASASQQLGSAVHILLLEPSKFATQVLLLPKCNKATKMGKLFYQDWQHQHANWRDCIVLSQTDWDRVHYMADHVLSHNPARALLQTTCNTYSEYPVRWFDKTSGVWLKACFDRLVMDGLPHGRVIDIKTASEPYPDYWTREATRYGYHRQAWLYQEGCQQALGLHSAHYYIVIGSNSPYECLVYHLEQGSLNLARSQVYRSLQRLADCRRYNNWDSAYAEQILSWHVPAYAREED